jgi:hypothetical protein
MVEKFTVTVKLTDLLPTNIEDQHNTPSQDFCDGMTSIINDKEITEICAGKK